MNVINAVINKLKLIEKKAKWITYGVVTFDENALNWIERCIQCGITKITIQNDIRCDELEYNFVFISTLNTTKLHEIWIFETYFDYGRTSCGTKTLHNDV